MQSTLWLLIVASLFLIVDSAHNGPSMFPRRRSSTDPSYSPQMQSRAVDTSAQLQVIENEPRNTVVGYIPTKPGFTYRFNEPPREFTLDSTTGEIKTNMILDREKQNRYDLVVLSSQPTYPIEVRISILDINDNPPEFPELSIAVTLSESSAPGTRLLLDAANDIDVGINSVTDDYRIVNGNFDDKFRLAVTTNPSGDVSYLHLETTGKLDRETSGYYKLNISARDNGSPVKYGYLQVNVTILDVNDNPPIFDHSDYIVSLNESVGVGTPVLQVMASDSDLGDNSKITYYLSDTETQFTVDPETGVISTTDHLLCPQQNCPTFSSRPAGGANCPKSCVFTVFARDHGNPRQDGRTYVTVNLLDTNDHDPIIRFQYFPPTGTFATVDENAVNGSVVAAVSVDDIDEGLNGETSIRILSGNELKHFRLEKSPNFDIVRVNGVLDREEIGKYNLTVVAADKGNPSRTATAYLIINVNDVNDHEPVFEKSEYSAVLSELAPPGTYVSSITATDEDTGVNAQIFYDFVSGNNEQWFTIDVASGLIVTKTALDREIKGTVELSISAHDGGPNPKWAYTQLKVTILDENDEAPQFSQQHINVSLSENTPPNTLVAMLTAADHDQGTNGSVTYSLQSFVQQKYNGVFALDSLTGQLTTKTRLDRETIPLYEIHVIARDQGMPPQSSTATVFLKVEDINDNSPEFYPKQYFIPVSEDSAIGTSLLKVTATDKDEGDNAIITYNLESGGDGLFNVDNWSGVVSLRGNLKTIQKPLYKLYISSKDRGDRKSEKDAVVEIIKESKLEELEFDTYGGYDFQMYEDHENEIAKIGREVGKTQIRTKTSIPLEYSIIYGDSESNFRIDEKTGLISTASKIDRESSIMYTLLVVARSGLAYGKTTVNISILDLNDNAPVFLRNFEEMHLPENAAVGQEVFISRARDKDYGINSRITYSMAYNPNNQFRISESSGVIYLNRPIHSDPTTVLHIEVIAADSGEPSLSAKNTVMIIVDDVNDHTPVFDHTSYETSLLESTAVNARFFALAASDTDLGLNGKISYTITEGNGEGKFGIFPDGNLFVKNNLDREEKDYYSLTVTCSDEGIPSRSSNVPVIIHVIDENDNSPQFTNSTFIFTIPENEPSDSFVGKLTAVDRDIGRNAELIFTLLNVQDDFTIDPRNGFIKTLRPFDREALVQHTGQPFIILEAIVSDNGLQKLTDKVKVKIVITDTNDNTPMFLREPYKVQISEGSIIGTQLIRVYTNDIDEGLNGDIFYYISEGNSEGKFVIDDATGQISLMKQLDRETVETYKLQVIAHDASIQKRLSATATIQIDVLDENDDAPEFTQTNTNISVNETAAIGTELIKFRATDSDLGLNSQITFTIVAGNRRDTFHIDPISGSLYLHKLLDYEDTVSYSLNITASDGGNPRLSTTIMFVVNVIDANDNPPNFPNTAIVRQIKEGIPINTPIVTITAEDSDSGVNGKVTYAIANQDPENGMRYFGINSDTGVIRTLKQIDRETIDTFRLTVVATDKASIESERLSAEKLVTVIVEDVNDNAPIFVSMNAAILQLKDITVAPGQESSHIIMNIFARDADSSSNGLVTYEMVSGNMELFKLHRSSGAISLRKSLSHPETRYKLSVKATDEAVQSERKSSDAYMTIIASSLTNNGPVFEQHDFYGSVYENEPSGTSILTVMARLNSATEIEYYVTNVTGDGKQVDRLFDIDTKLGILSTAAELDRESGVETYEVEVHAIAVAGPPRTSNIKIKVTVMDKNDSPPTFQNLPLLFTVSEDLSAGQTVATILAIDPDTIGKLQYVLVSGDDGNFSLDKNSGIIKLKETLDREIKDTYKLVISVTDGKQHTEAVVLIQVTDTNDNPPVFSQSAYSFDIPENAQRGFQVGTISATDPDLGANSLLSYTVISDWANDVFSLNPQTGVFTLTARLDYEEVQHYILVVQAQDNGHPALSTTITVYCNVFDLNDNAPIFDPMSYTNEIYESASIGTSVVSVSATDIDSGENGMIHYSITSGDGSNDFVIITNGTILTNRELDRETQSSYNIIVTARDSALDPQQRLSSTVQVTIILRDVNDFSPTFVTDNETSVSENIPVNTVVMAIKAIDRDEGRNGYIEYSLATEPSVPFTLGSVDGLLRVAARLDRELKSKYLVTVTAKDRGEPPKFSTTQIDVNIIDENDNSPVFDPKQYSASIAENASIGASVLQVSATDVDEGPNGRVRFSIAGGDENRDFSISEDSGVVRVAKNLNYERKSRYVLTIRAEDCAGDSGKTDSRYDTSEIIVTITDINDNPPTFLDSPYLAFVMENVIPPNGGYVITVKAYDADTPPFNSQVRYFLKEGDADLFRINASTGEISLLRALDRESQAEYTLTLVAMDTGSPPLTGTGTVRVIVQDVNDHSPEFERQSYRATVSENVPAGTRVLQPVAIDKDSGLNSKIRFSLLGENVERFQVDPSSGEVTTATNLDREETALYHLTLMAQDSSATEPRASAVNLTINVIDMNDNSPVFEFSNFNVNIPDRVKVGQFVFGVKAIDLDEGDNGRIVYSISGKDYQKFVINQQSGVIKTAEELALNGHGIDKVYSLVIHASDQAAEPKTASAELTILLRPAHLFPTFSYMIESIIVLSEDVPEGKIVCKIVATSPKKGAIGHIKYAIAGGNSRNAFNIDSTTGDVTVSNIGLDYETSQQYEVWVEAADSDRPSLRSVVKLVANVTDSNDNAPIIQNMLYRSEIIEEESPPQFVARINATDADSEENGQISFRLLNDFDGTFEIDADTGEIYTSMRMDREETESFELIVEAVDQGMPQLTGTSSVIVTILDKNDNPPRFTRLFSVNVTENAEIGAFVIKVTSSDLDIGENANATYSFTENPGGKFFIDSITGNVTVAGHLDREQLDEYLLKVAAVDGAWRAETPLTITIQDQNDNAPEFEHSYYSFNFPELQRNVAFVGQVTATDRDKLGPNSVISYAFQQPSDVFSIDPASGELFSKKTIKYKHTQLESSPENMYSLTILATDNGKPPMYSECLININVVDANNNSPKFEQNEYLSPVPEDALIGQRVVQIIANDDLDFGINAEIDYLIIGGNGTNNFILNKNDGWISVSRPLKQIPGVVYILNVRAIDKGVPPQQDERTVVIVVTGENKFVPVFTALSYQVIVPENEPIGSTILIVSASDNDDGPNGMIRYTISGGNERKEFNVDNASGAVTILQPLDYDIIQEYHLNITAKDLGFKTRFAVAMLTITLTDINDNAPTFNQTVYNAYLAENLPEKSFVYKVFATDKDSPKNAIMQYSITGGNGKELFEIEQTSGILSSKCSFDYEETNIYNLEVLVVNPDSPLFGTTKINVYITGVNEFYPKFIQPVFHFDVSESAEIGTSVGIVQATDKDSGDDGKVYYLLIGSSNDKGFNIHPKTGVMNVARNLDRETQSRVVLTVMAKNYGSIRGNDTDEAQVIISIQDGNDPPEFILPFYESNISEGASIGTRVVTVKAIDKDVRPLNNQFSYSIIGGNGNQSFKIDPQNGQIETSRKLDRETIPIYNLVIGAIDTGIPPQTGTALVKIFLSDINDNGPTFAADGLIGYVTENEIPGTAIMTLSATDPDLPPNGAPFTYYLIGGRHKTFVTLEKHTGLMKTSRSIDRESTPDLDILVEVEDNGKPKMRSQYTININVLDQNDSPSTPRIVHIIIYILNNVIPIEKIADIRPNDPDITGEYKCKMIKPETNHLTIVNGCNLQISQDIKLQAYSLSVAGNDGKHADVISTVDVEFKSIDNYTISNSITLRLENITGQQFLTNYYTSLTDILKSTLSSGDELILYSIRENKHTLELSIAVKTSANNEYRDPSVLLEKLNRKQDAINQLLPLYNVIIGYSPCSLPDVCANGGLCSEKIKAHDESRILDSQNLIFTSPLINHEFVCSCPDGYTGTKCDKRQDPCSPNPCQSDGQCRRQGYDFQCLCPAHREGKLCQLERGDLCTSNPCRNGGSCRESQDGLSFFCLCRPGHRGNQCETISDSCRPNPCLYGGLCVVLKPGGYTCNCADGRYGRHCERVTFGFGELSFMEFPMLDASTNDISIIFATTKQNGILVYNYGTQSGGRSDFIAIEIIKGKAVFSFGGARTSITSVFVESGFDGNLANGNWHKVTATRNGRVMSLSVSKCTENGDICVDCRPGDATCYSDDIGPTGTLNFNKNNMLVGGVASADPILERPGQIHSDDLVGCVHSISVNGRSLNLSQPIRSRNILPTCGRNNRQGPCSHDIPNLSTSICGSYGDCIDKWHTAMCKCGGNLLSPDCFNSLEPITMGGDGALVEFKISEKHRRMQLLDNLYNERNSIWNYNTNRFRRYTTSFENATRFSVTEEVSKTLSLMFRTHNPNGIIFYAATNKYYTLIELRNGKIVYNSKQGISVNMTVSQIDNLSDGKWHNITLYAYKRVLHILIDDKNVGDELESTGVHDFLDPYLTVLSIGGIRKELYTHESIVLSFDGCFSNFTINNEIQPFINVSGTIFKEVVTSGKVYQGCHGALGVGSAQVPDPLSIGITLVIVFFVVLLVAIMISFIAFRLRKQHKEKHGSGGGNVMHSKHNGGSTLLGAGGGSGLVSSVGDLMSRGMHNTDPSILGFHNDSGDLIRGVGGHSMVGPELISKKYKERELGPGEQQHQRPQRPDIIEREVVTNSPALRDENHPPLPPSQSHLHQHGVDLNSDFPEHYDLENASSIAPSDIDIVYHYKGYREAAGVRKYKATPPVHAVASYTHHKHQASSTTQQHRHSPHHVSGGGGPYVRVPPQTSQPPPSNAPRQHQSTPLARLSPSSELSSQQPRILTLHDISGKPLQSALLATTSSSGGGVGKDALHSNSERSLNSPVMSQLSGQSSSASRKNPNAPQIGSVNSVVSGPMGLTAEEIHRLNAKPRASSLVSTLDAVSSSSEAPRTPGARHHLSHMHHSPVVDDNSSTTTDESGNDSFTCSEIEYDNNSINGDKYTKNCVDNDSRTITSSNSSSNKPPLPPPLYDDYDSPFRGSLSTLVASDDDLSAHMGGIYRQQNGSSPSGNSALGWDYLLNWGPNFESLMGVFKDIAELPDTVNGHVCTPTRNLTNVQKSSEEYV